MATVSALIVGILSTLAALFGIFHMGKKSGKAEVEKEVAIEKVNVAIETAKAKTEIEKEVQNVETTVAITPVDAVRDSLRDEWSRD